MSRTDQLPAVLPSGAIAPAASADTYIVPALVAASGHDAIDRFLNFFATQIENDNTREAYLRAAREFLGWCERHEARACWPTFCRSMSRRGSRS